MEDLLVKKYISQLDDEDPEVRIEAINQLGESGDGLCLKELRARLERISNEHMALVIAVGRLKRSLGIE